MTIETFEIKRHTGRSQNWHGMKLIKSHIDNLNTIGETGKILGTKISIQEYFDNQIKIPKKVEYKILELNKPNDSGNDTLLVIRCTI